MPEIILADEDIAQAREIFGDLGEVRSFRGSELTRSDVEKATALLVRSVTCVDKSLLAGTGIRFVGSATIGTDHVDRDYLDQAGITFAYAPGSNADSVADYVLSALLQLCIRKRRGLRALRVGIVGCGQIGRRLAQRLPHFGAEILLNDPPLATEMERKGLMHRFRSLDEVLATADVVTLHVPLERRGPHPTAHLIGQPELEQMKPGSWLINTSRGPVVDNGALKHALSEGRTLACAVLDVWEAEPEPDVQLLRHIDIATPHIAGYAYDAKLRGSWMLFRALRAFLEKDDPGEMPSAVSPLPSLIARGAPDAWLHDVEWLDMLVKGMYDIHRDDDRMREIARDDTIDGRLFAALRRDYPIRREFSVHSLPLAAVPERRRESVQLGIGVKLR